MPVTLLALGKYLTSQLNRQLRQIHGRETRMYLHAQTYKSPACILFIFINMHSENKHI